MDLKKLKDNNGFTLMEIIIAIVIISIVIVFSVSLKDSTFREVAMEEGVQLIERIETQIRIFRAQNGTIPSISRTTISNNIDVNATRNKYFKEFSVSYGSGNIFTVDVYGSGVADGITMQVAVDPSDNERNRLYDGEIQFYKKFKNT